MNLNYNKIPLRFYNITTNCSEGQKMTENIVSFCWVNELVNVIGYSKKE